ncbi:MAG TPA: SAM-dependent methyltransferase [Polyangiaceae bacterium]
MLTRTSGRASAMPASETLEHFAASGATLAIHLSVHALDSVVERLLPHYGAACPIAIVFRATWSDQHIVRGTLGNIVERARERPLERSALILVGRVLGADDFRESSLYSAAYQRRFRGRPDGEH